jgi:hypothetical protein
MAKRSGASDMNSELAVNGNMGRRLNKKDIYTKRIQQLNILLHIIRLGIMQG